MVRLLAVITLVVSLLSGCIYMRESVQPTTPDKGSYENYPTSLEANAERHAKRRKYALIAAPIEIALGTALAAAAIYGKSEPSMSDSPSGALADAGKDLLGRLLLVLVGGAVATSGVGDGILGAIEPALPDSMVRNGKLIPKDQIDATPPPTTWRPAFEVGNGISARGLDGSLGLGASRWLTPTVRMQLLAVGDGILGWHSSDLRGSVVGQAEIERSFGREYLGLYPKVSLGLYAFSGATAIQDRHGENGPIVGGGLQFRKHTYQIGAGVSYIPYVDAHPMFGMRFGSALWLE
ncbi:MAG TPA: hypothetical protein VL326_22155 [Kofleriaceae bacterium]|nr:hypothetical protein [Kofleriaceae bacterium]